jgi:predicted permease
MHLPPVTRAVRNLTRRPAFTATAILLLALGAGANAAVFSVVRGVLLRPLGYHEPDRLVALGPNAFVSNEDIAYWRDRDHSLAQIAAISPGWMMALVVDGVEPRKVTGGRTSDNFFRTLGVSAVVGRTIMPGDSAPGRSAVVVLSYPVYEQVFGADPRVVGRNVRLDSVVHEIIGVMPRGFEVLGPGTDVWAPLTFDPSSPQHRAAFSVAFARLRPGTTAESATGELRSLLPAIRADLRKSDDWGRDLRAVSLQESVTGDVRPSLLILLAAVGLILLLAAVNLGTLVLGRSIERVHEMAVRTALGASRWRLVKQLVTEHAILASIGALAGLLLARIALPALVSRIPPELPRQADIALDAVVFLTVFVASVILSLLIALVPVVLVARPELQPLLRQKHSTDTPSRRRALGALVVVQIALAIVLGICAGLMLRSLWNLQHVHPGFDPRAVLTFRLQTTSKYRDLTRGLPYFEQLLDRVRALPAVTHVGAIQHLPMTDYNWTTQVWRPEHPPAPGATPPTAVWRIVGWDYFGAMRIPLRAGRLLSAHDTRDAPPVMVVNEAFARKEFGDAAAAVGKRVVNLRTGEQETVEIVGVTGDVRYVSLDTPAAPEVYRPLAQTFMFPMGFVVRSSGDPSRVAAAIRQAAFAVDPTIPVAEMQPLSTLIAGSLGRPRLLAMLLSVFAGVGLALGVVGVYGAVAYRVRQQERELGIRLALGAGPDRIAQGVLRQGVGYAAAGFLIGIPGAFGLTRLMASVVFGVTTHDALTFCAIPLVVIAATLVSCAIPARRAARVNPATAMRVD